jgi:hypothetical protein
MKPLIIYYHQQTNSWWTDTKTDGFTLKNRINTEKFGLGIVNVNTYKKSDINGMFEIQSAFLPKSMIDYKGVSEVFLRSGVYDVVYFTIEQLEDVMKPLD